MYEFVSIVIIVFGILQIILFFKLWWMTNNIRSIVEILNQWDSSKKLPKSAKLKGNGEIMDVLGMKNGKILCRPQNVQPSPSNESLYFFDELEF